MASWWSIKRDYTGTHVCHCRVFGSFGPQNASAAHPTTHSERRIHGCHCCVLLPSALLFSRSFDHSLRFFLNLLSTSRKDGKMTGFYCLETRFHIYTSERTAVPKMCSRIAFGTHECPCKPHLLAALELKHSPFRHMEADHLARILNFVIIFSFLIFLSRWLFCMFTKNIIFFNSR